MIIQRAACLAFTAACLTGIATLPAAHAQTAYGTAPAAALPGGNPGGNSMGTYGPNPGGPGLTPYTGGAPGASQPYPNYPNTEPSNYGVYRNQPPGTYGWWFYPTGTYGATQPYPGYSTAPSAAGTSNTEVVTNGPQGYHQPSGWSPERNVVESEHYDRLLERNRAFREARERKECGPITDPELHQQCLASFAK